ncbi:hypothetical protein CXB51_003360 [Gossypium anomalum]|uniref:RRM domain-containing protein n=1 Tax=Gossypium anomalum TaxID=47600 RepID=A0A8J5Z2C5_9ROSI|nr:hypothetical protein CXB51_003360 [Gossypium anomalum]
MHYQQQLPFLLSEFCWLFLNAQHGRWFGLWLVTLVIWKQSQINKSFRFYFSLASTFFAYSMPEDTEYRCFIGNLSWFTSDRGLKDAFEKFGNLLEAKVATDKFSGRSRGFGFVTFDEKAALEEAIEAMNGMDLDGRNITVDTAKPQQGSGMILW